MAYTPAFDTVETREASWLGVDPAPGWSAAPPLLKLNGGPFDAIQAFFLETSGLPNQRAVYINRVKTTTEVFEMSPMRQWRHDLRLTLTWDFETVTGQLEDEQKALLSAVAALEQRIWGPSGDKTHGGQFASAVFGGVGMQPAERIDSNVDAEQIRTAYEQGQLFTTTILYPVYDLISS